MKNRIIFASLMLVLASVILVSCKQDKKTDGSATVAVTDSSGITHYYELVTDKGGNAVTEDKNQAVFAEIVTDKSGAYITNGHTTVLPIENEVNQDLISNSTKKNPSYTEKSGNIAEADNTVNFELSGLNPVTEENTTATAKPDTTKTSPASTKPVATKTSPASTKPDDAKTSEVSATSAIKSTNPPATDSNGWVTKWY